MAESSSSSLFQPISTPINNIAAQYDVFVSFRGEDVRNNFVSHLQAAFKRKGIATFFDEELKRGQQISPALLKAIQQSSISVVVFSENYASSRWCLDELLKILECRNIYGQIVLPVFYGVDPSNVRKQTGSYREAFTKHHKTLEQDEIQRWREALTEIANLSGLDSSNWRLESEIIDKITEEILKKLDRLTLNDVDGVVVIEDRVERIESCLRASNDDVRILGIWGMGGIGKTTVATALFHKIKYEFVGYCFLENVRENSGKNGHGLPNLRKMLLSQVTQEEQHLSMHISRAFLKNRLSGKKVLIVLDDVDDIEQLEYLAGGHNWFGVGSRIIITTRNRQLLTDQVDEVYDYAKEQLSDEEALLLFSRYAFKTSQPPEDYLELSRKAIHYASGIPLALKLLGSYLRKKDERTWKSALARLERFSDDEIYKKVLELSFEGLNSNEKNILLDVACFFKGEDVELASLVWDACGFFSHDAISVLSDKCLVSMQNNNSRLWMHDLTQEMCKAIVRKESVEPGERTRLWEPEDIFHMFNKNTGTSKIQCIILNLSETKEVLELGEEAFVKMEKLRLLKFFSRQLDEISTNIRLPRGLTVLPDSLSYLFWDHYPNKFFASKFHPQNLVGLYLRQSCIRQLWKGHRTFKHLKQMDLNNSKHLSEIPDLSGAQYLEHIDSHDCTELSKIHPSVSNLSKLTYLNLSGCKKLRNVASNICMERLERLILHGCENLQNFPAISGNMERLYELSLDGTGVSNLPSSIENLTGLTKLKLSNCKKLVGLPNSICNLKRLEKLSLSGCENLQHLPENIGNLESLSEFYVDGTSIKHIPSSIIYLKNISRLSFGGCRGIIKTSSSQSHWLSRLVPRSRSSSSPSCMGGLQLPPLGGFQNLISLCLSNCNLVEAPSGLHNLPSLSELDLSGNNFETLPQTIFYNLHSLSTLELSYCTRLRSLPDLPPNLHTLLADECTSLESIMSLKSLFGGAGPRNADKKLKFANCLKLKKQGNILESLLQGVHLVEKEGQELYDLGIYHDGLGLKVGAMYPGSEIPEWFSNNQTEGNTVALQLPRHCIDNSLAFALCLIVSQSEGDTAFHSDVSVHFRLTFRHDSENTVRTGFHFLCGRRSEVSFKEDHVVFGLVSMSRYIVAGGMMEPWPKNCNHIECFFRYGGYFENSRAPVKVKRCVVRLVNVEGKPQPTFLLGCFVAS